jgi:hypothetical protein
MPQLRVPGVTCRPMPDSTGRLLNLRAGQLDLIGRGRGKRHGRRQQRKDTVGIGRRRGVVEQTAELGALAIGLAPGHGGHSRGWRSAARDPGDPGLPV